MTNELDWVIHQQNQKTEFERKQTEVRKQQSDALNRSMSMQKPIPNMSDAYAQVRAKNYQPTQQEIEYQRFTSGAWIDNEKGK